MKNYLLLGVMNDGTVRTSQVIQTETPTETDFKVIQGKMANLLGKGRRKDWYFRTQLVEINELEEK